MSGSVFSYETQSGKRWGWVVDLKPTTDPATGREKRSQCRRQGYRRKIDAEAALEIEAPSARDGSALSLAQRQLTVEQFAATWAAGKVASGRWRPTTQQSAEVFIRCYIVPELGRRKLSEVDADDVRRLLSRAAEGKLGSHRPLSPRTLNQLRVLLAGMFAQAARERLVSWNPVTAVDPVSVQPEQVEPWTTGQRDQFLQLVAERRPDLWAPLTLASHTGIRRGELAALTWARTDLDNRRLRVEATAVEVGGEQLIGPPKSERSRRTVPFGQDVCAALRAHKRQQAADRLAASEWEDRDLVLTEANGGPVPLYRLTTAFGALAREAGLSGSLHILRHSSVCCALRAGVPPHEVAAIHGHSLTVMMATYAHWLPDELNRWGDLAEAHRDAF